MEKQFIILILLPVALISMVFTKTILSRIFQNIRKKQYMTRIRKCLAISFPKKYKKHSKKITLSSIQDEKEKIRKKIILGFSVSMVLITIITMYFNFSLISIITLILFYIIGLFSISAIQNHIKQKQRNLFIEELPTAIDLISRSIGAGQSIPKALQMATENFSGLLGHTFKTITDNLKIGNNISQSLKYAEKDLEISEFKFFSIIIHVHNQVGGNVVKLLNNLSESLREQHTFNLKVKALSSESIASGFIIGSIPIFIIIILSIVNPQYIAPMINTKIGHMIIGLCIILQISGIITMRKIIRIDT